MLNRTLSFADSFLLFALEILQNILENLLCDHFVWAGGGVKLEDYSHAPTVDRGWRRASHDDVIHSSSWFI